MSSSPTYRELFSVKNLLNIDFFKGCTENLGECNPCKNGLLHEDGWYWCGDICAEKAASCMCGNTKIGYWYTQQQCCVPSGQTCSRESGDVVCPSGQVVHRSQPCNGECREEVNAVKTKAEGKLTCSYNDSCNYALGFLMCGSVCADPGYFCYCGQRKVEMYSWSPHYCCVEEDQQCTHATVFYGNAARPVCSTGTQVPKTSMCRGVCYNDYHHSKYLGPDAQLTCARLDKCMPRDEWCQGVQCSEEADMCGEQLRCAEGGSLQNITTLHITHHFCSRKSSLNTRTYENIDRSDEEAIANLVFQSSVSLSSTTLASCLKAGGLGLTCNQDCKDNFEWCRKDKYQSTCTTEDNVAVQSDDPTLCGDHRFWRQQECSNYWSSGSVRWYGRHCTGTFRHCTYPWYYNRNGKPGSSLLQSCQDDSDKIFHAGVSCPDGKMFLQMHNDVFSYKLLNSKKDDPHGCQNSCSTPGGHCTACSNKEYFTCTKSGVCIHPSLLCDGHSQCEFGEDEAIATCLDIWVRYKTVSPSATLECSSRKYPGSPTLATACDGTVECLNNEDEVLCQTQILSIPNLILTGTILLMMVLYLVLKYSRKANKIKNDPCVKREKIGEIFKDYEKHSDNPEIVTKLNNMLLHIIKTLPSDETKKVCKSFYALVAKINKCDESKIFHNLHLHLHPLVVDKIYISNFPGFTEKLINFLEFLSCSRIITKLQDRIIRTPWMKHTIDTIITMVKISANYADLLKDTILTVSLMRITGGLRNVLLYPTQFTSVIVLGLAASILGPIFMSSINLALNNPFLLMCLLTNLHSRRSVAMVCCVMLSVLTPILLIVHYQHAQERMRIMVENNIHDGQVTLLMRNCMSLKNELVEHLQIELGKCSSV